MEGVGVHEADFLMFGSLVPGDDDEPGGQVRVVVQQLSRGRPAHEHLCGLHNGESTSWLVTRSQAYVHISLSYMRLCGTGIFSHVHDT